MSSQCNNMGEPYSSQPDTQVVATSADAGTVPDQRVTLNPRNRRRRHRRIRKKPTFSLPPNCSLVSATDHNGRRTVKIVDLYMEWWAAWTQKEYGNPDPHGESVSYYDPDDYDPDDDHTSYN